MPTSTVPLNAWFTVEGEFIGVSGIPIQLAPGQKIDHNAWYTADGRRAAIAGPFRNEPMNRQGYIRGAQILAAEQMQQAANKAGRTTTRAVPTVLPEGGLKPIDWASVGVGASGAVVQLKEWELVKKGADGVERWKSPKTGKWYPTASQPNRFTGQRTPVIKAAGRFAKIGQVCFWAGTGLSISQFGAAAFSDDKDREKKMLKAGLDIAMGIVGLLGPVGFVISTVYFVVDASISLTSNGKNSILDLPDLLMSPRFSPRHNSTQTPREVLLLAPTDNTRVYIPQRVHTRTLRDVFNQTSIPSHNAVFRQASH